MWVTALMLYHSLLAVCAASALENVQITLPLSVISVAVLFGHSLYKHSHGQISVRKMVVSRK
jgi:hypothetical protein